MNAEQIKKIFTSFNNKNSFELYHNDIPIDDVSLLENYISQSDEKLGTKIIPKGSWNGVIKVRNEEVKEKLLNNELCGVSLSNRVAERCSAGLSGQITYNDVPQIDCVIPVYISFVERGANGYSLEIMDYPAYIKKSENIGVKNNMSFDLLNGLKSLIKQAEEDTSEPVVLKEENPEKKNEEDATILKEECPKQKEEETKIEKAEEKPEEEEEAEIEKAESDKKETAEEPSEEVAEETTEEEADEKTSDDELEEKITKIVERILAEKADKEETAEKAEEESDEPKITKSKKVIVENTNEPQTKNYFELSGRDPITGMKIRK